LARYLLAPKIKNSKKIKSPLDLLDIIEYLKNMNNEQRQKDINEALGRRALYGQRYGWGYAIKWFAAWEKQYNEKNPLTR